MKLNPKTKVWINLFESGTYLALALILTVTFVYFDYKLQAVGTSMLESLPDVSSLTLLIILLFLILYRVALLSVTLNKIRKDLNDIKEKLK